MKACPTRAQLDIIDRITLNCEQRAMMAAALETLLDRATREGHHNESDPILAGLSQFMRRTADDWRQTSADVAAIARVRD